MPYHAVSDCPRHKKTIAKNVSCLRLFHLKKCRFSRSKNRPRNQKSAHKNLQQPSEAGISGLGKPNFKLFNRFSTVKNPQSACFKSTSSSHFLLSLLYPPPTSLPPGSGYRGKAIPQDSSAMGFSKTRQATSSRHPHHHSIPTGLHPAPQIGCFGRRSGGVAWSHLTTPFRSPAHDH